MKLKKSLVAFAAGAAICLSGAAVFSGCDLFGGGSDKVTEITDLSNVRYENQNYKLTQDIDYEGGEEKLILCSAKTFDGDGHTIKNLNLRGTYGGNTGYIGMFEQVETIKNLYLENVTISAPNNYTHISVLAWSKCKTIENVHIKNLTINATQPYMGSGFGRSVKEIFVAGFSTVSGVEIKNCTLTDSNITVNGYNNSNHNHVADMHVAGMATEAAVISHCGIENTKIKVESTSIFSDVTCGGLSSRGGRETLLSYCYAKNNEITANANWVSKSQYDKNYYTADVYVGGLAASASIVNFCEATKNVIKANAHGSLISGGVVGSVTTVLQSIARNNTLTSTGGKSDNYDEKVYRATGGLAGKIFSSVTSSISINNTASDSATNTVLLQEPICVGGLAGEFNVGSVTNKKCYVGGNSVTASRKHDVGVGFSTSWEIFIDSSVTVSDGSNVTVVSQSKLKEPDWVLENLGLSANSWILTEGELPEINATYTPPEETEA